MKDLKFICVQPDDAYYTWQVHTWLESLKVIGHSDKAIVLVFTPQGRKQNQKWREIEALYPESEFAYIHDEDGIGKLIGVYIPVLRPYSLMKYFRMKPHMANHAIFYCDCDIVFTDKFNIDNYIDDDVCYLSDTNGYINAKYFDSKIKDVLPEKLEEYKTRDVLSEVTSLIGIDRQTCEKHNDHSGGAQYLLKNVGASFWEKVIGDCITIRVYLQNINRQFFASEDKGFQSWCADMWAVLWNLWLRDQETRVVPEMDFAWSSDQITKMDSAPILHNAGMTGSYMGETPTFYKGTYHTGTNPFDDPHLQTVINSELSKKLCNHYYLQRLLEVKDKYNLSY